MSKKINLICGDKVENSGAYSLGEYVKVNKAFCYFPNKGNFLMGFRPNGTYIYLRYGWEDEYDSNCAVACYKRSGAFFVDKSDISEDFISEISNIAWNDSREKRRIFNKYYDRKGGYNFELKDCVVTDNEGENPESILEDFENELKNLREKYSERLNKSFEIFGGDDNFYRSIILGDNFN